MDTTFPFQTCAVLLAALFGMCLWAVAESALREKRLRKSVLSGIGGGQLDEEAGAYRRAGGQSGFDVRALAMARASTQRLRMQGSKRKPYSPQWWNESRWLRDRMKQAGLSQELSAQGYHATCLQLAVMAGMVGALIGAVFSLPCCLLGAVIGAWWGFRLLRRAIEKRIAWRTKELERHLPEMLDVMVMGLRSGLSFDRALQLYIDHFSTLLSFSVAEAKRQWSFGLSRRDDALRALAETYDSLLFSRVVENIIRSLHFGTSMADNLESAANEARLAYQAKKQEEVAKAPVKMMLPTGALILPAMLLLVLGPVLLELIEGF